MRTRLTLILLGVLCAAPWSTTAQAQAATEAAPAVDCSKARDPQRCQAREAARAACQGKRGAAHRQCMEDGMPPPDCGRSADPTRCAAKQAAREACRDKTGPAHRQCMREQAKASAVPAAKP